MNIREMIDTTTALSQDSVAEERTFAPNQDVVIRHQTNRSGPSTFEIKAAKIVTLNGSMATVSIAGPMGRVLKKEVPIADLQIATDALKRKLIQFSPQHTRML